MLTVDISKMEAIVAPYAKSPNAAAQMLISTLNQTAAYEIADVDSASNGKDHVQDPLAINQVDLGYTLTGKTAQEVALMQGLVTLYRPCGVGKSATPAPNKSSELPPPPPKQTPAPEKPPAGPNTDPNGNEVTPLTPPPGPPPDSFPR
jgi:hypothetical protein